MNIEDTGESFRPPLKRQRLNTNPILLLPNTEDEGEIPSKRMKTWSQPCQKSEVLEPIPKCSNCDSKTLEQCMNCHIYFCSKKCMLLGFNHHLEDCISIAPHSADPRKLLTSKKSGSSVPITQTMKMEDDSYHSENQYQTTNQDCTNLPPYNPFSNGLIEHSSMIIAKIKDQNFYQQSILQRSYDVFKNETGNENDSVSLTLKSENYAFNKTPSGSFDRNLKFGDQVEEARAHHGVGWKNEKNLNNYLNFEEEMKMEDDCFIVEEVTRHNEVVFIEEDSCFSFEDESQMESETYPPVSTSNYQNSNNNSSHDQVPWMGSCERNHVQSNGIRQENGGTKYFIPNSPVKTTGNNESMNFNSSSKKRGIVLGQRSDTKEINIEGTVPESVHSRSKTTNTKKSFRKKWREEEIKRNHGIKWKFLEHKGPLFAPPYERLPRDVKFFYDGNELRLSRNAEEIATFYSQLIDNEITKNKQFNRNFFCEWQNAMKSGERKIITDLSKCDFRQMYQYFNEKTFENKREEELAKVHSVCTVDGLQKPIENFRVDGPGLICDSGKRMGMLKRRIMPEDVIINCSRDSKVPVPPKRHKWKEVRHDNTVFWLASWKSNEGRHQCYMSYSPS